MDSYSKETPKEGSHNARDSFSVHNGIRVTGFLEGGGAVGVLTVGPNSLNPHGIVHGGCLATLADTVAGSAVYHAIGKGCVTVNYGMNFLRPAKGSNQKIYCRALPEKMGRTLCVYRVSLTDDAGAEVAVGNFTFCITGWMGEKK